MVSISLITYCKGRCSQAREYVPAALKALRPGDELVFVDYDDSENVGQWAAELRAECLTVVRADGLAWFHVNHARNIGGRAAVGELLIFSDVDFLVSADLIEEARTLPALAFFTQPNTINSFGFVVCRRSDFQEIQGWDEAFIGYGCDDICFRESLFALPRAAFEMKNLLVPISPGVEQVRMHQVSQGLSVSYNSRLKKLLRVMHPYRQNLSRNWGWGGRLVCESEVRRGTLQGAGLIPQPGAEDQRASVEPGRARCDHPGVALPHYEAVRSVRAVQREREKCAGNLGYDDGGPTG